MPTPASTAPIPAKSGQLRWTLLLILLFIIWSNSFHAIFWLRRSLDAWTLVTARFFSVGLFCAAWFFVSGWRENLRLLRAYPFLILASGVLMVPVYNVLLNWGQGRVHAGTAALLIATNPFFTYLLAMLVRQERLRLTKVVGLVVSFTGVYLLLRNQGRTFGADYPLYALATLGAPLAWALATVLGRPLVQKESPLRVLYLALGVGSLPFTVIAAFDRNFHAALVHFSALDWIWLAHLSVLCTVVGFAIWYAALRHLPASGVAAFVLLNPPLTIAFGQIWGTEPFSLTVVAFGAVILSGVILSNWGGARSARRQ